jgi:hypothetical protein
MENNIPLLSLIMALRGASDPIAALRGSYDPIAALRGRSDSLAAVLSANPNIRASAMLPNDAMSAMYQ